MRTPETTSAPPRPPDPPSGAVLPSNPTGAPLPPPPAERLTNAIPIGLLLVAWAAYVFWTRDRVGISWLLPGAGVAALGALAAALRRYPRRPRSLSLGVLGLFALYTGWVGCSALWAGALEPVWYATALAGLYLVTLGIALTYLTDGTVRRAFRYLVIGCATGLVAMVTYRLWTMSPEGTDAMFRDGRLVYPLGYANASAALYLVFFWPLLHVAADGRERAPVRGLALGLSAVLLCPWVLTQSRGALWALLLTAALTLAIAPVRLRILAFILAPLGVIVWAFPVLDGYWSMGPLVTGGHRAATVILEGFLIASAVGWVLAALEPWIHVSKRMKNGFGLAVAVGAMTALVFGYVSFARSVDDPGSWARESWTRLTAEETVTLPRSDRSDSSEDGPHPTMSRLSTLSANGRVDLWTVAWSTVEARTWAGVGAGNYVYEYDRLRTREQVKPPDPHNIGLQVLSETGVVGTLLLAAAFSLGLGGVLWARFSAGWSRTVSGRRRGPASGEPRSESDADEATQTARTTTADRWGEKPREYAWETALVVAFSYWLIHAAVDRLWAAPAVTILPLLFLAAGAASVDARAGVMWPRWARLLPFLRAGVILMVPPMFHLSKRKAAARAERAALRAEAMRTSPSAQSVASSGTATQSPTTQAAIPGTAASQPAERRSRSSSPTGGADGSYSGYRRADKYAGKRQRRRRKTQRKDGVRLRQYPPGPLSTWFRRLGVLVSFALLVALLMPLVSLSVERSARSADDTQTALRRARIAAWAFPVSPAPVVARAEILEASARSAPRGLAGHAVRLDALALALDAHQEAITRDRESWSLRFAAGMAALALADADSAFRSVDAAFIAAPGQAEGTPATSTEEIEAAARFRDLPISDVLFLAESHLKAAAERNPLSRDVDSALQALAASATNTGSAP